MAKRLLLSILVDVLGNYVEGLTVENLKLGVWSGKLELHNLSLKQNALDGLNLPIEISHGTLKHLRLKIPWTSLESKPVKVEIDGVYLQAGPLDLSKRHPNDIKKGIMLSKRSKLQEAEDFIILNGDANKDSKDSKSSSSYFRNLAIKIIDNIEITLSNVHIRYEDNQISIPNRCLAAGLTIANIRLSTTDEQWKDAFIIRGTGAGKDGISNIIRKLGIMENLALYWNGNETRPLDKLSPEEWLAAMHNLIFRNDSTLYSNDAASETEYILSPPSLLTMKIIHRPKSTPDLPKIDINVLSSKLVVNFEKTQYQELLGVIANFSQLDRYKQMSVFRPKVRPKEDPRGWWKYAFKLVLGKDLSVANRISVMIKCKKVRDRYIQLLKKARKHKTKSPGVPFPEDDQIAEIEEDLPFSSLLVFRKIAAVEMLKDKAEEQSKTRKSIFSITSGLKTDSSHSEQKINSPTAASQPPTPVSTMSSFFSWGKKKTESNVSSNPIIKPQSSLISEADFDDENEDNMIIENFQHSVLAEESVADEFPVRVQIQASTEIHILSTAKPLVDVRMTMQTDVEVRAQKINLTFSLGNVVVEDMYTENPTEKYLARPQQQFIGDSLKQFLVQFESYPVTNQTSLSFSVIPMDFTFNSECFQKVFEMFLYQPPVIQSSKNLSTKSQVIATMKTYAKDMSSNRVGTFSLLIDIKSPTLILPRNSRQDSKGYVILDCGHFNLDGKITSSGVVMNATINGINVGMPDIVSRRHELQKLNLYLVKPFSVSMMIQNIDKVKAELTLEFRIYPSLQTDIDVDKLRRLIAVILIVTNAITGALKNIKNEVEAMTCEKEALVTFQYGETYDYSKDGKWLIEGIEAVNKSEAIAAPVDQRRDIYLSFSIETVTINTLISSGHHVDLEVNSLTIGIVVSSFETNVIVDLKTLAIVDSLRPEKFRELVWTPKAEKGSQENLFHMSLLFCYSKNSALYRGCGTEISIEILRLGLDLDDQAILRLCPFFRELTKSFDDFPAVEAPQSTRKRLSVKDKQIIESVPVPSKQDDLNSLRLEISIAKVVLNMIQPRRSVGFERLFAVNIIGFNMQYEFITKADMKMTLETIDAEDTRHESEGYYYKNLVCRSTIASEYSSTLNELSYKDENDASSLVKSTSNFASDKEDKIFHMTFIQESETVSCIEIDVQDITGIISPDSLLTFINILMADINSIIALIAAITSKKNVPDPEEQPPNTLKLTVRVINPRLLVLEDPREQDTQAIVAKCGVVLHFTVDTENGVSNESMHVSVHGAEIFALQGLSIGHPQQIIDPTSIEFHMKRTYAKTIVLSSQFVLTLDSINIKVSFHDLLLSNSIITRTIQIAATMDTVFVQESTLSEDNAKPDIAQKSTMMLDVLFNAHNISLTVINDYGTQNLPVLRLQIFGPQVHIIGPLQNLNGEGSLTLSVDYYNTRVTSYEPILEPWKPVLVLSTDESGVVIDISNDNTLQLNVSGALTRSLIECSNLFSVALSEYKKENEKVDISSPKNPSRKRIVAPALPHEFSSRLSPIGKEKKYRNEDVPVTFINSLGIPINIVENRSKITVANLEGVGRKPVIRSILQDLYSKKSSSQSRFRDTSSQLPNLYDVHILGEYQNTFQPLFQLPLNVNVARHYYLQIKSTASADSGTVSPVGGRLVPQLKGPKPATTQREEIVTDEVFENSRFDVVSRKWGKPWYKYGDPDEWTDDKNHVSVPPSEKPLPSDKWEWIDSAWRVDMTGVIGKDIDELGFEYNINFNSFNLKKKRAYQPLDSVRRRRWIRSRKLKQIQSLNSPNQMSVKSSLWENKPQSSNVPLTAIFWDVQLQPDGSRNVLVRSGFGITNSLEFAIDICLYGFSSDIDREEFCNISPGDVFYVPLRCIQAKTIEIRPTELDGVVFDWSTPLDCRLRASHEIKNSLESYQLYFVDCNTITGGEHDSFKVYSRSGVKNRVFMRIAINLSSEKSVSIECMPFAVIYNRLPSSFAFKCVTDSAKENGVITPASKYHSIHVNPTESPTLSIQLGSYVWSSARPFEQGNYLMDLVSPFKSTEGINLSMTVTVNQLSGLMEVFIFSKYALIDRTGLNMSIRTRRFNERQISYDMSSNNSNTNISQGTISSDPSLAFMDVGNTIERRTYDESGEGSFEAMNCWTTGGNGVALFQSATDTAILGFNKGKVWSFTISLISLGSSVNSLEVLDKEAKKTYQLAYQITPLPHIFQETIALIVTPWYRIVNCMEEQIEIRQADDISSAQIIQGMMSEGWHRSDANKDTRLQFKTQKSQWSIGSVDVNEIGTNILLIPVSGVARTNSAVDAIIIHVEVKFAEPDDLSYVTILIWKESTEPRDKWTISVKNDSSYPVTIRQELKGPSFKSSEILSKFEISVDQGHWLPFGWADQSLSSNALLCVGTTLTEAEESLVAKIDMLKLGEKGLISLRNVSNELSNEFISYVVQAVGSGKVLRISNHKTQKTKSNTAINTLADNVSFQKEIRLYFRSIGVSLIAERPIRREFLSLYLEDLEADIIMKDSTPTQAASNLFEFKIHDIQIDNYSESAFYPILLHSYDSATRKKASKRARYNNPKKSAVHNPHDDLPENLHFFQFTLFQEVPLGLETPIFKYVALRVLEIKVALDSSTIQLYLLDIHNDLIGETIVQDQFKGLSPEAVDHWVDSYNVYMTTQAVSPVDPIEAKRLGQAYKIYLETLVVHPFKITASFQTTAFPRDQKFDIFASKKFLWLQFIRGIAGIEELTIKITSFIVKNVMESQEALTSRIVYKITKELQKQLLAIAGNVIGSLNVIGRPAGLYKNIGSGVEDFFYEPYQGAMHSPQDFLAGVGRGAGSLIQGVGRGVITSAAAMVGSASSTVAKGATFLTGDEKFARDRDDRRREQTSSGGGVFAGIRAGGENVISGFSSGITGLITKPIEEGRKAGAKGFLKGVGLGVVGAAVKPIMGITDGIASVTQGLTNAVSDSTNITQARPARAFERSPSDGRDLILVNLDVAAAQAQQSVVSWSKKENYRDTYLAYINLGFQDVVGKNQSNQDVCGIILSEKYVFFIKHDGSQLWRCPFGNISHVEYIENFNSIRLVLYQTGGLPNSDQNNVDIHCSNAKYSKQAYIILSNHAYRMGNPSLVNPAELVFKSDSNAFVCVAHTTSSTDAKKESDAKKDKLFHYTFGSSNHVVYPSKKLSLKDILHEAHQRFSKQVGNFEFEDKKMVSSIDNIHIVVLDLSKEDRKIRLDGYLKSVDERCMQLVCDWRFNQTGLKASRCLVTVIINMSAHPIQLVSIEKKEGKSFEIFSVTTIDSTPGYSSFTKSIEGNGGAAVVFGYGNLPTVLDLAHVKLRIQSTAFTSQVSSRPIGTTCEGQSGFTVGFLEKTLTDWWAKFVILVI